MAADPQDPATKQDIAMLMESIGKYYDRSELRIGGIEERMGTLEKKVEKLDQKVEEGFDSLKRYIDVKNEELAHDVLGAQKDRFEIHEEKLQSHEVRIGRLEEVAGVSSI